MLTFKRTALLYNLALVVLAALIMLLGRSCYQNRMEAAALVENRFITTEWYLLQIIKSQTDDALEQKNIEIRSLQTRYELLKEQKFGSDSLRNLELRIKEIQDERDGILDRMALNLTREVPEPMEPDMTLPEPAITISQSVRRVELETLQKNYKTVVTEVEELQERLRLLDMENQTLASTADMTRYEMQDQILDRDRILADFMDGIAAFDKDLQEKDRLSDKGEDIDVESLYKFELIKVILDMPEIVAQYPDLEKELEHYIDKVVSIERTEAGQEAYEQARRMLGERFGLD